MEIGCINNGQEIRVFHIKRGFSKKIFWLLRQINPHKSELFALDFVCREFLADDVCNTERSEILQRYLR